MPPAISARLSPIPNDDAALPAAELARLVVAHDTLFTVRFLPNRTLDTSLREAWRFQILTVALHLHDLADPVDARSGLTIGRLQAALKGRSLASAGRIAAILKQLEAAGYLETHQCPVDRRIQILTPTETLLDAVHLWERIILSLVDIRSPGDHLLDDVGLPQLGRLMRQHMMRARLAGWTPLDGYPDIEMFATRDGGWRLLSRLAAMYFSDDHGSADAPLEIDLQAFARETATSRSSLRRLLEDAAACGLLDGPPRNGRTILPSRMLMSSFANWLAMFVDAHRGFALKGRAEIGS